MQLRQKMEELIEQMLDGRIMLDEAVCEFEKIYIEKAVGRNDGHISQTASKLGIHRNTLSKRVAAYSKPQRSGRKLVNRKKKK